MNNLPIVNRANSGKAIPVKFGLGGDKGLQVLASGSPTSQKITCDTAAPLDAIEETVTPGSSALSYDAASRTYTYVWKTDKAWKGTCRQLTVTLSDGTNHLASFKFD